MNKKLVFAVGEIPLATVTGHRMVSAGGAPYVKIGGIEDHNVAIRGGGGKSRIGLDYLRQFRVTIDVPHDRIYLAKGAEFDKPGKPQAVGIGLLRRNGKTVVTWIEPNSPATEAGIAVNDELMTLAGEPIAGRPLEEVKWMLREKAGPSGKLKLMFRRANKERKVEVTIRQPRGNREQAAAIAEIQRLGGDVTFDEDAPGKPVYGVYVDETHIGDGDLKSIEGLSGLKVLILARTKVTDAGLKHIAGLTELRTLYVYDTRLTDAGLEHIKGLVHLEFLNLSNTQVTDAGLKWIEGFPELLSLNLDNTRITDDGLKHLKGLKALNFLSTVGTQVTPAGRKELKQALPNLDARNSKDDGD